MFFFRILKIWTWVHQWSRQMGFCPVKQFLSGQKQIFDKKIENFLAKKWKKYKILYFFHFFPFFFSKKINKFQIFFIFFSAKICFCPKQKIFDRTKPHLSISLSYPSTPILFVFQLNSKNYVMKNQKYILFNCPRP